MITLGVDLAAQPRKTGACLVSWTSGGAEVTLVEVGVNDERLLALAADADKVGIDVPFGWPQAFVGALVCHQRGDDWPDATFQELCFRETDRFVRQGTGKWPLSVSTDRIGVTAFRAANLLSRLAPTGSVDRSGKGKLVEVYPAAALRRWALRPLGRKDTADLAASLLGRTAGWLRLSEEGRARCESGRDALDSLIAALVARAAAVGLCEPIPPASARAAEVEGWIALPTLGSLDRLAA